MFSHMATVILRKDREQRPYYYACFTDANGRRLKKSTGLTSRSKAQLFANKLEEAASLARQRTLTEERAREIISEIVASVHGGEGLRSFSVKKWFEHFAKIKADSQDPKTAAKYLQIKSDFLDFLGAKADRNILAITSADVRAFRDHRKQTGVTATTLNDSVTILSAYFNGALKDHVIASNPCSSIEAVKDTVTPAKRRKQPFTIEQIKALLASANDDWRGLIKTAFYTSARLENCANLRFCDLDFSSDPPLVVFPRYSKTGDEHGVPMAPALADHLLSLSKKRGQLRQTGKIIKLPTAKQDGSEFLFPSLAGRRVANLSKQFRKLMNAAGIENRKVRQGVKGQGKSAARDVLALGFHSFRRTSVSCLANLGVPEERRMLISAHADRDIHRGYTHHELKQLHKDVSGLPAL
jgi:integrase